MFSLYHIVLVLSICSVPGLILPITKPDGTLDVSSLLSHISQFEQSIENKASAAEVAQLKSELAASQKALTITETKLENTTEELQDMKRDQKKGGATFTRWGRTSCPVGSNVMYKGYTAGSYYKDRASSANILCLPDQPIYANHTDSKQLWVSKIYGTNYGSSYSGASFEKLYNEDMPCVVCESDVRSSAMMVPARNQCIQGWTLEYSGYLMGSYFKYVSGEYICVDSDAEAIPDSQDDVANNGQVLYAVVGKCGSLRCPPYHENWELACAVCSK